MANSLSASFPTYWSRRMQRKHYKVDVYRDFVTMEEAGTLSRGNKVNRPYRSQLIVNDMGSDGSYSRQDLTDTNEQLTVDKEKEVTFYVRDIDKFQSNYNTINDYADDAAVRLGNQIGGDVFSEMADNATSVVDAGSLGGNAGEGITLTKANVLDVVAISAEKLDNQENEQDGRLSAISPHFKRLLKLALAGRDTVLGDQVGARGRIGMWDGFQHHLFTGLQFTAELYMATLPTDGDTITITVPTGDGTTQAVTFTWKATLGSTAGNIHIASTVDICRANLAAAINTPGTTVAEDTDTGFVALSTAAQNALKNISATNNNTTDVLTLKVKGRGFVTLSETLTAGADEWTPEKQIQHNIFARGKTTDLVIQKYPNVKIKDRTGYVGNDVVTWTNYGVKTFSEGKVELVDVKVRTDALSLS